MALNICDAVIIPIYVKLGSTKLQSIIEFYSPDYIVTDEKHLGLIKNEEIKYYNTKKIFVCTKNDDVNVLEVYGSKIQDITIDEEVTLILSSSGTTSAPKGIMLTNKNIISNTCEIARYMNISMTDSILMIKSINHSSSITGELLVGLFKGCTIHIYNGIINAQVVIDYLKEYKISVFFAVPSILVSIVERLEKQQYSMENYLKIIHFYGAVAYEKDIYKIIKYFSESEILYSYGLTEASPRVTYANKEKILCKPGTSGSAINDVKIQIKNENNVLLPYEQGEIVIKGPNVMKGYYKNDELTKKVLVNDELYTGDLGYIDEENDLFVIGRKDNMIIKNGRNIYPEEIEKVISMIDGVTEALVTGKSEIIIAYVVCDINKQNIRDFSVFCRHHLEDYKVPDKYVFVPELKKNANNKILRNIEY